MVNHHGIKLTTKEGNQWLLHNTPGTGVVVTDAKHMSNLWRVTENINIGSGKTVGNTQWYSTSHIPSGRRYWSSGTCIGTANRGRRYLRRRR